jgi:hypothetical protein
VTNVRYLFRGGNTAVREKVVELDMRVWQYCRMRKGGRIGYARLAMEEGLKHIHSSLEALLISQAKIHFPIV